jgi:glycogen(starch) synthase
MRALRVAVVARSTFPLHGLGGLERHVFDLVQYLANAGVDVTLITRPPLTRQPSGRSSDESFDPRVKLIAVPYRTFPGAGRRGTTIIDRSTAYPLFGLRAGGVALDLVREKKIDIVHGLGASVLGYARKRATSAAPLVLNPQGMEEFGATSPGRALLKRAGYLPLRRAVIACARAADRVIATDRSIAPVVRAHLRVPDDRIRIIPNALSLPLVDRLAGPADGPRVRAAAGIGRDDMVLLSVGRLEENKGFHVLAAALGALKRDGARLPEGRWRWVVIGEGPYRRRLEHEIAAAGLADVTVLAGRADDRTLHAWYEAATLFVHPTLYEGSSLVTLEAMAHRRAAIASAAGGLPDKVRPGENGWLVAPGDPSALAAAISGALADPVRLAHSGLAGRAIVEREFSWTAAGDATVALYRELLG